MLTSMAYLFLFGLFFSHIAKKLKLPSLVGLIFAGILVGPYGLNLLSQTTLAISQDLRQFALIIIITRAGLSLKLDDLKKVGRPALFMSFIPASLEILGVVLVANLIFKITFIDSLLLGAILAAVSPAVVVPRMISLIENKYGTDKGVPQLILAGASLDDIYVLVLFSTFITLTGDGNFSPLALLKAPISLLSGIILGLIFALLILRMFNKFKSRISTKVLILLSLSFLFMEVEQLLENVLPISALIAIITLGLMINKKQPKLARTLSSHYETLWIAGEIVLFTLLGASVDVSYIGLAGVDALIIIFIGLLFRMLGVYLSLIKTHFNKKEKLFIALAYTPKATVQAALGPVPLAMGLASGQIILTISAIAILTTAPLGALFIDKLHQNYLIKN